MKGFDCFFNREGHNAPPRFVRYVGIDGKTILSAGTDSTMRILSSAAGHHPASLGRASFNKNLSKKKSNNCLHLCDLFF